MAKPFYVTTPIYYPSDRLHIGHALTTTMADTIARYKRMQGYDVFFLTGSDEHGQKIEKTAREAGMEPIEYTDRIVASFQELWQALHIEYSDFIRTTEKRHHETVAKLFRRIYEKGDIYKSEYEGYYCTPCETFFTERQLQEKACPDCHRPVELIREESYFFRMSRYQDRLIEYIETHPEFIEPATRRNEMLSFLRQGLEDLCVSRTTFDWGIPVPIDPGHVIYVWFDALTNYLTAVDYLGEGELYQRYWDRNPEILHLLAKDILRFHTVIWPIILMAADVRIPRQVFAHGWLLMDGTKMSKSKGNVIDPMELSRKYGADAIRYFLLREMPYGDDGYYTEEALVLRTNTDLANDYGNLLSRTTSMINKFAGGTIPAPGAPDPGAQELAAIAADLRIRYTEHMDTLHFAKALQEVWKLIARGNKYIEETAPWELAREEASRDRLATVLYALAETIRIATIHIAPFMPSTPARVFGQLGLGDPALMTWESAEFGAPLGGLVIDRGDPIFPRIDPEEALAAPEPREEAPAPEGVLPCIGIGEFQRSDLRVAEILEAERVEKTEKLLRLTVDAGSGRRTIVAGIARHYEPAALIGRKIVVVANLEPVKLRGITSEGMLLAATAPDGSRMSLLTVDGEIPAGTRVG